MLSRTHHRRAWMAGTALAAVISTTAMAQTAPAAPVDFQIAAGDLGDALGAYAKQAGVEIFYQSRTVAGRRTPGLTGPYAPRQGLDQLLAGTGLIIAMDPGGAMIVQEPAGPQGGSAAGNAVQALIVTAQKREEDIQDVPIAISAFSQEDLTRSQVAGGPDLMTQVPNMTFTKTNFSSYSIQIRGIGTQAISATTDPAVAVAFNNTPFVRNHFFEQEFYDLERVEVLRGPQGTLYGRNATAGVVNVISAKPKFYYEAKASADVANYGSTRLEAMVNVPLAEDVVALRLAGAWTKRDGYVTNEISGNQIDGRDLWSTRLSLRFAPTDSLDANLIWEHFQEDDDRLRSGKQLCHRDARTSLGGYNYTYTAYQGGGVGQLVNQGCLPASLYSPDSFEAPNGFSLPFYGPIGVIGAPLHLGTFDPYVRTVQSRDLRVIESTVDPHYRVNSDLLELQVNYDLGGGLTLTSETAYSVDDLFSTQDYNRFNTTPDAFNQAGWDATTRNRREDLLEGGIFCDPQIGCADRLVAMDLSTSKSSQFSQEIRIGSDFEGPFNFSLGSNFLRHDTVDKYYVFINTLSLYALRGPVPLVDVPPMTPYVPNVSDNRECLTNGMEFPDPTQLQLVSGCEYVDPNPIGSLNDLGHNYFLSKNPYKLISYAVFGEAYYNLTDTLKLTAGLRWTVDKKEAPRIPSWLLAADTVGYPVLEVVEQEWRVPTGRLAVDWKPALSFTDETLLYASYVHGYKAGGANPPPAGVVMWADGDGSASGILDQSASAPKTFEAEYVDAFEIGSKNTLLNGALTLNLGAFYYDYEGYQISYIVNRSAVNLNFDARIWGLEIEADWRPVENLRLGFKGGYENTRVADGERAIDVMERNAGHGPDSDDPWIVIRPFPTFPSNCIIPLYTATLNGQLGFGNNRNVNGNVGYCEQAYVLGNDPVTGLPYVPNPTAHAENGSAPAGYIGFDPTMPEINNGEGFYKDLSGNELPNAPHFTATITADYTIPLSNAWLATLHTDLYYQSEAWTRIFNMEGYDKLKAYSNINLAAIFTNEESGWNVMAYVKNVLDRDSITGAFLNSDDSGLTTNVFLTEPRLYGIRVTKAFDGGPWWTGADPSSDGPFPLTVEIGGQVQRQDAPYDRLDPSAFATLSPSLNSRDEVQNRDLDWGDGRSVRLTYQAAGSPWSMSAGVRYGRTNSDTARARAEEQETFAVCGVSPTFYGGVFADKYCNPTSTKYDFNKANYTVTGWADATARNREEHTIADFEVGRDVGLGAPFASSHFGLALRYADFNSISTLWASAKSNFDVEEGWAVYGHGYTRYEANLTSRRDFEGSGPVASWSAAIRLLGAQETGQLNMDWTLSAGVLFGDQKASVSGEHQIAERFGLLAPIPTVGTPTVVPLPAPRSQSVTAPLVDLSLGASYEVGRMKIGAGYRWERYFDVLDTGFTTARDADRTIDGPYFKIAVGFGG